MKKIRKWLGFCILTMLTVLAGITVFADGKLPGGKAYGTYFPNATIQKVWEDNDNKSGKRPEKLTVNVAFLDYYNERQEESVTLSEKNNWTHRFPGEWKVTYVSEQGLTDDYGFKSYEVIDQGYDNYLLKVTNGLCYPVNYAWTWEDENGNYQEQENGYAWQYLPSKSKYMAGKEVEVSSTPSVGSQATQDGIKYVFEGWDRQGKFIMPEEAVTINGKWKRAVPHTVSYEWEGLPEGAHQKLPVRRSCYEYEYVRVDSAYRADTYIEVGGDTYRFSGWKTDWEGFGNGSSFRMPDQDVLFKGEWKKVTPYKLTYKWKWDDGTGVPSDKQPDNWRVGLPDTKNYTAGDTVTRDWRNQGAESYSGSGENRQYYVFSGWKEVSYDDLDEFYDAEEAKEEFLMPAKDMTLYGVWKKMPTFTVRYEWEFEGLDNVPSSPSLSQPSNPIYVGNTVSTYNTNYVKDSTTNVKGTKYRFSGWTAYKDGNDDNPLSAYDNTTDFEMPKYNIVFKGVWKPVKSYAVEYQWDGLPKSGSAGYSLTTSVLTVPKDSESPHIEGETVNKDMTSDQYVQTAGSIDMDKAYKIKWRKYDIATHKYVYKYTYYYFSGWTAYDKQEYTVDKNATPLQLNIGADGTFKMPKRDILFVGHWTEIDTAPYTVTWYKIANKDADPDTAQLIARRPNPDTRDGKPDDTVSVTERDKADINEYGWYTFVEGYKANVTEGTVSADNKLELKLYFVPKTGDLKVSKTVAGNAGETNKEFAFKVTLTDVNHQPVNGTFGDITFVDGKGTFNLKHNGMKTITGIPTGTNYKVEETDADQNGYITTKTGDTGTISKDTPAEAKFTNTKSKVEVTSTQLGINGTKKLNGRDFKEGDQFKFYIRDSANAPKDQPTPSKTECVIKPTSGNTAKIDFDSTFTFTKPGKYIYIISEYQPQHGGTEIIPGITYDTTAYRLTVTTATDQQTKELKITNIKIESSPRGAVGQWRTLYEGGAFPTKQYCEFTNTYKPLEQIVHLTGTKVLEDKKLSDYGNAQFEFILKAVGRKEADGSYVKDSTQPMPSGSKDGVYTLHNLVTGGIVVPDITFTRDHVGKEYHYTITEKQPTVDGTYDGRPLDGAKKDGKGKLVYKGVTFDNHVHTVDVKAEIVQNAQGKEELKVAISHDEHGTGEGAMQNFIFTNTYDASTKMPLTGTKKLTGREFIQGDEFKFNITPVGSAPVPVDSEGNAISSVVINPTGGTEENIDFGTCNFRVADLNHENEKIFEYKITEEKGTDKNIIYDTKERIVRIKVTDDGVGNMKAEVVSDPKNLIWNNQYPIGDLTVSNKVGGNAGDKDKDFHFKVMLDDSRTRGNAVSGTYGNMEFVNGVAEFTLKHDQIKTAENLPAGIVYKVVETDANEDGYETTSTGEAGTIANGSIAVAAFTNTKNVTPPEPEEETGNLTVYKTVEGNAGDKNKDFNFTVKLKEETISGVYGDMEFTDGVAKFALKHGQSATAEGLPAGVTYEVTEAEADQDGYVTTSEGAEGTIPEDETVTASFTNTKEVTPPEPKLGDLKVSKTVEGNAGDKNKEFHFTVKLEDETISGVYGDIEFTAGVAEIMLKHGESATAEGLPAGAAYEVTETEADQDGYVTTSKGAKGTLEQGETVTASFTNTKEEVPPEVKLGNLKVGKTVEGNAGDKTKDFHFTVKLEDETISGTYGDMEFTDGVAEFALKHDEWKTATKLPTGIGYTVAEDDYSEDGYVTTQEGAKGTIPEGETITASFTNTKEVPPEVKLGNLKVGKTVEGNAGDKTKEFHFTVKLEDETISGVYGDMEFTDGVAEIMLKHGDSATAEGLLAGIEYTVAEDDYSGDGYVTTQKGAEGTISEDETAEASFTNTKEVTPPEPKRGDLKVSKTVEGNAGDKEKAFHFTVTLSDSAVNGTYGDMEFTDGVAEIMLKHGESKTAEKLPAGVKYTVTETEADKDGYTTAKTGDTGTITKDATETAAFTNTKNVTPEKPEEPEKPVKPENPNTTDTSDAKEPTPKTGDQMNMGIYMLLLTMSGLFIATLSILKKKRTHENR